jgi:release factor glutamine methyltransferase
LAQATRTLAAAGIEAPRHEAEILLGHLLKRSRAILWSHSEESLPERHQSRFLALCRRRAAGEPMAYLTGHREFWSLDLLVDPRVLIPRPETEHLVEAVLARQPRGALRILDYGAGSGCIALALATEYPQARIIALDMDWGALAVAGLNCRRHNLQGRVKRVQASSLDALAGENWLDVLVSNPPYIRAADLPALPATVRQHEPLQALSPGPQGLEVIDSLVRGGLRLLLDGGTLALEVDSGAAAGIKDRLRSAEWADVAILPDLAGMPRVVVARRRRH